MVAIFIVLLVGCSQPSPTPTPTQAPKAAPPKEAAPAPKAATPAAKTEAKQAEPSKAAKQEVKAPVKLKVPYVAVVGTHAVTWIAKEKGLFEKYGLDVELDYIAGGSQVTGAMLSGEVSIAQGDASSTVSAVLAGADLVFLGTVANVLTFSMYATPEIKRVEDLRGKVIGVSRLGSTVDYGARYVLRRFGLEPDKDVAIVQMGGNPEALAAMKSGGAQAGIFGVPTTLKAQKAGMHEIVSFLDLGVPYPMVSVVARKQYVAANQETVRNFLKAYTEGIAVAKKEKDFAKKVIGQYTKTDAEDELEETYDYYVTKIFPRVPYTKVEAVQGVLDEKSVDNPKAKEIKPDSLIDMRILKELDESGFINKLYAN